MRHKHWVQRGDNELEQEAECALSDEECTFGIATARELGEWVNFGQNYAFLFLREPPVPFATWLRGHQKRKEEKAVEDRKLVSDEMGFYPRGHVLGRDEENQEREQQDTINPWADMPNTIRVPVMDEQETDHPRSTFDVTGPILPKVPAYEQEVLVGDNRANYQEKAMGFVKQVVDNMFIHPPRYGIHIVWFCKTLQNWKALIGTTLHDDRYYEVTYNGDKKETYVDVYVKTNNIKISDEEEI